jgi:hypothetical protein
LNAFIDYNDASDITLGSGCKCLPGFSPIYDQDNAFRCERTADVARANCNPNDAASPPVSLAGIVFHVTELATEIEL